MLATARLQKERGHPGVPICKGPAGAKGWCQPPGFVLLQPPAFNSRLPPEESNNLPPKSSKSNFSPLPKFTSHRASSASLNPQWGRDSSMWGVLRGQPSPPWFHCPMTPSGQFPVPVGMPTPPPPKPLFPPAGFKSHSSSGQGSLLRPPRAVHRCGEEERGDEGSRSWGQPQGLTRHHGQVAARHK